MSPMRTLSQLPFSAMLAVATIATPAGAQSADGTISGTLALEEATWVITSADRSDISSGWTETDAGYDVRIVGTPGTGADSLSGALVVEFSAEGSPTRLEASDVSVTYHKPNADAVWRGEGTNVSFDIEALDIVGDDLIVAASLVAAMVPGGADGQIIDGEDRIVMDGNLQATLGRRE